MRRRPWLCALCIQMEWWMGGFLRPQNRRQARGGPPFTWPRCLRLSSPPLSHKHTSHDVNVPSTNSQPTLSPLHYPQGRGRAAWRPCGIMWERRASSPAASSFSSLTFKLSSFPRPGHHQEVSKAHPAQASTLPPSTHHLCDTRSPRLVSPSSPIPQLSQAREQSFLSAHSPAAPSPPPAPCPASCRTATRRRTRQK